MKHVAAYEGKVNVSLGLMQEAYVPFFVPWINWRIGIEGTLQGPPYSHAQGIEWIRKLDKSIGTDEVFAVLRHSNTGRKRSYQYVGHMGIHKIEWPEGFGGTGSLIGAKDAQGRGLGTEAKLLLLYHAFMILGLRKVISSVKAFNAQSAGHLLKCGYKIVGRYHKHNFHEGHFIDEILFEAMREDWEPIWEQYQKTGVLPKLTDDQRELLRKETSS